MSEEFPATDKTAQGPLCLRFWTHMFGNGVGRLFRFVIKNKLKSNRSCLVWTSLCVALNQEMSRSGGWPGTPATIGKHFKVINMPDHGKSRNIIPWHVRQSFYPLQGTWVRLLLRRQNRSGLYLKAWSEGTLLETLPSTTSQLPLESAPQHHRYGVRLVKSKFPTNILTSRLRPLALETVLLRMMSAGKCLEFYPKQVF